MGHGVKDLHPMLLLSGDLIFFSLSPRCEPTFCLRKEVKLSRESFFILFFFPPLLFRRERLFDATRQVGGSNAMLGVFGAMCVYSLLNIEPEWNPRGCALRLICTGIAVTALIWLAGVPTIGAEHVVNNRGHVTAFAAGGALAYGGLSPLFSSDRFAPPDSSRLDLVVGADWWCIRLVQAIIDHV